MGRFSVYARIYKLKGTQYVIMVLRVVVFKLTIWANFCPLLMKTEMMPVNSFILKLNNLFEI